jgi:hypothetical protein
VIGALIARYTAKARGREDQERAIELQAAQQRHAYELQVTQMSAGPRRQPLTTRACTQFGFSQAQARSG